MDHFTNKKSKKITYEPSIRAVIFIAPAFIVLFIFILYPVFETIRLSFYDKFGREFVGLYNYKWAINDPEFRRSILNNLVWLLVVPTLSTFFGLVIANLADRIWWGSIAKSIIFMPMAISFVGAGVIWKFIYEYRGPDKTVIKLWEKYLLGIRKAGSSCGAIIEVRARGVPLGLGAPIYSKLDMDLAAAMMSINAVKGVNIGSGMKTAQLTGEQNSDEISQKRKKLKFYSNNAGGILGGISTGQEIIVSFAVKPTSSILKSRKTIDKFGKNTSISVKGRHDPCVGIRAVPIGEAMLNCVLLDHYLLNKAQCEN